ncbi:carboxypeptidase B-like [Ptychodera flava]|uniref:carboxypeptidase B-like n=1 Tax=Ptychodera flava TaxID=63121 RepID=UPI00396A556D
MMLSFRGVQSFIVCVCFLATVLRSERVRFDGYEVLRVTVGSEKDLEVVKEITASDKYDVWSYPGDIMTAPSDAEWLKERLREGGLQYQVMIADVQKAIDNERAGSDSQTFSAQSAGVQNVHNFNYFVYHRYSEIDQWIKNTAAKYPGLASEFILGRSYEKRVMRALKVGNSSHGGVKEAMWIHSGIHAREWITPATNMWMTNQMLMEYGSDDVITELLDRYDLYILICMNPDGYEFTWDENRLWRKTRTPNLGSECVGTDPNRNWDYEWGGAGVSFNPCSTTFCGPYPQSEIEVKTVVDFLQEKAKTQQFRFFMDIHSFSNMFLNPWGYTSELPADYDEHMNIAKVFVDALEAVNGIKYTYGTIPALLYPSSGSSVDWGYGVLKIKYSHALELRDDGTFGFLLPEDQIEPTARETYAGFKALYAYIMERS